MELLVFMGVGGWGWSNASSALQIGIAVWLLPKTPAVSASAAEATTEQIALHSVWIGPFRGGGKDMMGS